MISEDIFVKDYVSSCSQEIFFHERNKRYSAIDLYNRNWLWKYSNRNILWEKTIKNQSIHF